MGCTVFANGRGVTHKGSGGMSTVFPDLCLTKVPVVGVVPIPYPPSTFSHAASIATAPSAAHLANVALGLTVMSPPLVAHWLPTNTNPAQ